MPTNEHTQTAKIDALDPSAEPVSTAVARGTLFKGHYEVESELGSGSFGVIYRAHDRTLNARSVVIKVLLEKLGGASDPAWHRQKFQDEIAALARIYHPGVVAPLDVGETADGRPYLIMEFVPGQNLREVLRGRGQQPLDFHWVATVMRQLGSALSAAHKDRVLHRDLKPENIMVQTIDEDEVIIKVIDFGIATILERHSESHSTKVAGTPVYMAPEQFRGHVDVASDIYGLGVIAYELVTGTQPFRPDASAAEAGYQQLIEMKQAGVRRRPCEVRGDLPLLADELILQALAANPAERPRRAKDWTDALARALTSPARSSVYRESSQTLHTAHVLFMDLVGYSKLPADEEIGIRETLDRVVTNSAEFRRWQKGAEMLSLDSGDGMALVFLRDPESPASCAAQIAAALRQHPEVQLRMGIHTGAVILRKSIGGGLNVSGEGINTAQRVMSCGDAGHVLVSHSAGEFLRQLKRWAACLHDLGEYLVKHDARIHLFNLYAEEYGNPEPPPAQPGGAGTRQTTGTETPQATGGESGAETTKDLTQEPQTPPGAPAPETPAAAPTPPEKTILTRLVAVTHMRDSRNREALFYTPGRLSVEDEAAPEPEMAQVREEALQQHFDSLRAHVDTLNASGDNQVSQSGLTRSCRALSRDILPEIGLPEMLGRGVHPQFDIMQDFVTSIPWEALETERYVCRACDAAIGRKSLESEQAHCRQCDQRLRLSVACEQCGVTRAPEEWTEEGGEGKPCCRAVVGGFAPIFQCPDPKCGFAERPRCRRCGGALGFDWLRLALAYHISHLVRVPSGRGRGLSDGRDFLFIEDPLGDLCSPQKDPHGFIAAHLKALRDLVKRQGYQPRLLQKESANPDEVLRALHNSTTAGVYYFGHGFFPREGNEGCLLLHNKAKLFASQIEKESPMARLVFINACSGAEAGRDWDLEKKAQSIGHAFARSGPGRIVIAPLWPILAESAARFALQFFENAILSGDASARPTLGEALQHARQTSYRNRDLAWRSYRCFGNPDKTFHAPSPGPRPVFSGRVFDTAGQLDTDLFAFAIEEALLRAARRRNAHGRAQLSLLDLLAGLLRKGDLTRFVLGQAASEAEALKADELYETLRQPLPGLEQVPAEAAASEPTGARPTAPLAAEALDEEQRQREFARLRVRQRNEFEPALIRLLENADRAAQQRQPATEDRRITEQLLIEQLLVEPLWQALTAQGLPAAEAIRQKLAECARQAIVDENGVLLLTALDAQARQIVERTHLLAQQLGVFPIRNRLMLAAFMLEVEELAERLCAEAEIEPALVTLVLIASTTSDAPANFALTPESGSRIVLPVLEAAAQLAANPQAIAVHELFRAFCQKTDPAFKEWLLSIGIDLDKGEPPPGDPPVDLPFPLPSTLTPEVRRIVEKAHTLAQACGSEREIPTRLLMAAFLTQPDGALVRCCAGQAPHWAKALIAVTKSTGHTSFPLTQKACARIVTPTLQHAQTLAGASAPITETLLFQAFCQAAPDNFKPWFQTISGVSLDELCQRLSAQPGSEHASQGETPTVPEFKAEEFEPDAWQCLLRAVQAARQQGWREIRSPHLFVGMLGDGKSLAGLLAIDPLLVKQTVLQMVEDRQPLGEDIEQTWGESPKLVVRRALALARAAGSARVKQRDLLAGLLADGGAFVAALEQLGWDMPLHVALRRSDTRSK